MARAVRTAISLPAEDFEALERTRKRLKKPRSEIIREALRSWHRSREIAELERRYVEGYRKVPEDLKEIESLAKAATKSLPREKW
ncbi:MAG: ribbon-helix-helix protein, CopG family [Nitrospirae bacterium]|nr:ribbon-helix-helix protein, CopG family [Nitrospirota bacterium]